MANALDSSVTTRSRGQRAWFLLVIVLAAAAGLLMLAVVSYSAGEFRDAPAAGPSPTTNQGRVVYLSRSAGVTAETASDDQILAIATATCRAKADSQGDSEQINASIRRVMAGQGMDSLEADRAGGIVSGAALAVLCPDAAP